LGLPSYIGYISNETPIKPKETTMKSHEIAAYNTTLAELAKLASDMNCPKALAAIARLQVNVGRNWSSSNPEA
jgi:hypothetical protein